MQYRLKQHRKAIDNLCEVAALDFILDYLLMRE
jgi:hypothetical protein